MRVPVVYIMVVFALGMITSMGVAVAVSNANTDRAVEEFRLGEERRRAEEAKAAEAGRAASCRLITTIADAYRQDPPAVPSKTYDAIAGVWADLAKFC